MSFKKRDTTLTVEIRRGVITRLPQEASGSNPESSTTCFSFIYAFSLASLLFDFIKNETGRYAMLPLHPLLMKILLAALDLILTGLALFLALQFQLGESMVVVYVEHFDRVVWPVVLFNLGAFLILGVYRRQWYFYSLKDYAKLFGGVFLGVVAIMEVGVFFGIFLPHRVLVVYGLLVVLFTSGLRFLLSRVVDVDEFAPSGVEQMANGTRSED